MRQFRRRKRRMKAKAERIGQRERVREMYRGIKERFDKALESYRGQFGKIGGKTLESARQIVLNALFRPGIRLAIIGTQSTDIGRMVGLISYLCELVRAPLPVWDRERKTLVWENGSEATFTNIEWLPNGAHAETHQEVA